MSELLNTKSAAERIQRSPKTLEKWRLNGGGPRYLKAGRGVLYRWSDVETWLEAQARQSTSEAV